MLRRSSLITVVVVLLLALVAVLPAAAQQPNFGPAIYADGKAWGTKGLSALPQPNDAMLKSFDKLFMITNSNNPDGQLAVAEAAPRNPAYNGGRWYAQTVEWTADGFAAHGIVPILKSYEDVMLHASLGHLTITPGSPDDGPDFFECPLLPVK
jgi:hypothetical protein